MREEVGGRGDETEKERRREKRENAGSAREREMVRETRRGGKGGVERGRSSLF